MSVELKVLVLSKRNDSRNREAITRMVNHIAVAPDPALFGPPPDYVVVDERGSFVLDISIPALSPPVVD